MKLKTIDQYVHTLFMLEEIKDDIKRIAKKPDKIPLRKQLRLNSLYAFKLKIEEQIVTYEQSQLKNHYSNHVHTPTQPKYIWRSSQYRKPDAH